MPVLQVKEQRHRQKHTPGVSQPVNVGVSSNLGAALIAGLLCLCPPSVLQNLCKMSKWGRQAPSLAHTLCAAVLRPLVRMVCVCRGHGQTFSFLGRPGPARPALREQPSLTEGPVSGLEPLLRRGRMATVGEGVWGRCLLANGAALSEDASCCRSRFEAILCDCRWVRPAAARRVLCVWDRWPRSQGLPLPLLLLLLKDGTRAENPIEAASTPGWPRPVCPLPP